MFRSSTLASIMAVGLLPLACSFQTAHDIGLDGTDGGGGYTTMDVKPPPANDGGAPFESDATQLCATTNPQTTNLPPDILIVLDRSGSMKDSIDGKSCGNQGCGATSKWTQMTDALNLFTPTVEASVNWGLKLFGSGSSCDVTTGAEAAPKAMNAAAIKTLIGKTSPGSSTPTTAAVTKAATYLAGVNDGNPKIILLATDGIPTCGTSQCAAGTVATGSQTQCDDANAIAAVKSVHDAMGIDTYVIGIGTANGGGDATLTSMAQAGGHPRSGTPAYYSVQSAAELTDAFQAIVGQVGSCTFALTPALDPKTQQVTGVKADGVLIPASDYTVGNTSVLLTGQSCADYSSGKIKTVEVQVICVVG